MGQAQPGPLLAGYDTAQLHTLLNSPMTVLNIFQLIIAIYTITHNYVKHACQSGISARASHPFLKNNQLVSASNIMPVCY